MPRAKIYGFISILASIFLGIIFVYSVIRVNEGERFFSSINLKEINNISYYAIAAPIGLVSFFVIGTGFWIGLTILSIKVVPPMPEIVEKKDLSKLKAFFLCTLMIGLAFLLGYGIYIRSYWALAIPAAAICTVILGAVFWVGIAIITTRSTLPEKNSEPQ